MYVVKKVRQLNNVHVRTERSDPNDRKEGQKRCA